MAWRANGDYYSFSEDMVRLHAPSASGVYGLYNLKHQILIDSSANIQHALLEQLAKKHARLRRLIPTGFVFETCPAELRESRAQELIREYQPILQSGRALTALWRSSILPNTTGFYRREQTPTTAIMGEVKENPRNAGPKSRPFRSVRERFALMATGFGVILAVVGLLTLFVGVETHRDSPSRIASLGKVSPSEITGETQPVSLKTAETQFPLEPLSNDQTFERTNEQGTSRNESIAVQRSQPDAIVASELPKPDSAGAKKTLSVPAVQKKTVEKSAGAEKVSDAGWTVQAIATTDKRIASDWLEKLKAKGYEPFVIKAEIKGRTWYRVRAGRFHTPAEGESLRSALQSQEGLRDAFIAPTTKSDAVIALSLQ